MKIAPVYEMPFMAATTFQSVFGVSRETMRNRRRKVRGLLGLAEDPAMAGSGKGAISIDASPVGLAVQAATRWSPEAAEALCARFMEHGYGDLVARYDIKASLLEVAQEVKTHMTKEAKSLSSINMSAIPMSMRINNAIQEIVLNNQELHTLSQDYSALCQKVEMSLDQIDRFEATVERIEPGFALLAVESGSEQAHTLKVDPTMMDSAGIEPGESLVVYEQRWSPDAMCSYYQPAYHDHDRVVTVADPQLTPQVVTIA